MLCVCAQANSARIAVANSSAHLAAVAMANARKQAAGGAPLTSRFLGVQRLRGGFKAQYMDHRDLITYAPLALAFSVAVVATVILSVPFLWAR
jgi:hypothetical protein